MKRLSIIALFALASNVTAADLERYNPGAPVTTINVPAPNQMQVQPVQTQPAAQKPEFKKFDIGTKPLTKKKKVKKPKKVSKPEVVEETKATVKNETPFTGAQPQYIDIQAILARSKVIQVDEKKESSHADQIEKATQKPDDAIKDMAKTVYTFIPGSIYTMWCKKGFVTDIQLQTGETITSVNGGDTVRWLVEQTVSGGNGVPETQHVLIKPYQADLQTNVIISTDKRVYQLKSISTDNTYSPIISWTYPADERSSMLFVQKQVAKEKAEVIMEEAVAPETLNFAYKIKSNSGVFASDFTWTPLKAFNDGLKTYIQVNPNMKNNESPALFVKDRDGNINLVNYRLKNNYFIVDRLFESAELRNGVDEIVTITKESK